MPLTMNQYGFPHKLERGGFISHLEEFKLRSGQRLIARCTKVKLPWIKVNGKTARNNDA